MYTDTAFIANHHFPRPVLTSEAEPNVVDKQDADKYITIYQIACDWIAYTTRPWGPSRNATKLLEAMEPSIPNRNQNIALGREAKLVPETKPASRAHI